MDADPESGSGKMMPIWPDPDPGQCMIVIQALKKDIDKNREKKEVTVLILGTKNDLTESRRVDYLQVGFAFHQYRIIKPLVNYSYIYTVLL